MRMCGMLVNAPGLREGDAVTAIGEIVFLSGTILRDSRTVAIVNLSWV